MEICDNEGVKTGETLVTIKGTYYSYLFKRDVYIGEFSLPELPETEKIGTVAEIEWVKRRDYPEKPRIIRYGDTVYENLGSVFININRDMDEFTWWAVKGVITTSYEEYSNSIFYKK